MLLSYMLEKCNTGVMLFFEWSMQWARVSFRGTVVTFCLHDNTSCFNTRAKVVIISEIGSFFHCPITKCIKILIYSCFYSYFIYQSYSYTYIHTLVDFSSYYMYYHLWLDIIVWLITYIIWLMWNIISSMEVCRYYYIIIYLSCYFENGACTTDPECCTCLAKGQHRPSFFWFTWQIFC